MPASRCGQIGAFINQVNAQTGRRLGVAEAARLLGLGADAKRALEGP